MIIGRTACLRIYICRLYLCSYAETIYISDMSLRLLGDAIALLVWM